MMSCGLYNNFEGNRNSEVWFGIQAKLSTWKTVNEEIILTCFVTGALSVPYCFTKEYTNQIYVIKKKICPINFIHMLMTSYSVTTLSAYKCLP